MTTEAISTAEPAAAPARRAARFEVHGTVQGVGFRPFVFRLATTLGLAGDVRNAGGHVVIRVAGSGDALAALASRLTEEAPPAARVGQVLVTELSDWKVPDSGFQVAESSRCADPMVRELPPDLASCAACVAELFDPADRRYRYPFLNCTECGPRATIVDSLPYDRKRTTMRRFAMCLACDAEYHDPTDRRFRAEPVACPNCGPRLSWRARGRPVTELGDPALRAAERVIAAGGVVAVKGIGGYQLVCDATNPSAVGRLRQVKRRPRKPFAVMVRSVPAAMAIVDVHPAAADLLISAAAPVVLLPRRRTGSGWAGGRAGGPAGGRAGGLAGGLAGDFAGDLADGVAPGLPELGLFLPYSPLHHLLLADLDRPLVVTSGNRADEPIAIDDERALATLGPVTDGILGHDRPILTRLDDSVRRVVAGRPLMIRRARGYTPEPLPMPVTAPLPVLAVGAHLKHTTTLAVADRAVLGQHTGDLSDAETFAAFKHVTAQLIRLQAAQPRLVAHDLHPGYLSTQFARRWPTPHRIAVQHHHAHVAAVAAEHGLPEPFLGVAYDGLGLGPDGGLWGGEVLLANYAGFRRLARFGRAPLPGGEAAVRRPARMALGYLFGAEALGERGPAAEAEAEPFLRRLAGREVAVVRRMVAAGVNCPPASSAGRLFDAVASLLGVCDDATYEGEAAVLLEAAADPFGEPAALHWRLTRRGGLWVYDPAPTLRDALTAPGPVGMIAARFHTTLAEVTTALVTECAAATGVRTVCLGGGVFQNRLLTTAVLGRLRSEGFDAYIGEQVPSNDGGISYGQAVVAAARLARG